MQDLRYEHRYRNYAIPIMTEYFGKQKTREETISWMSKQGQNFRNCPNWYKKQ